MYGTIFYSHFKSLFWYKLLLKHWLYEVKRLKCLIVDDSKFIPFLGDFYFQQQLILIIPAFFSIQLLYFGNIW